MGDRGNVYITDSTSPVYDQGARGMYLYSHWGGTGLPEATRLALEAGRGRWTDDSYLTRILVDQITKDGRDKETGYGLGLSIGDNEGGRPVLVVDLGTQTVSAASPGNERLPERWVGRMPFADYVKLSDLSWSEMGARLELA